jgi:hypothetical protein
MFTPPPLFSISEREANSTPAGLGNLLRRAARLPTTPGEERYPCCEQPFALRPP